MPNKTPKLKKIEIIDLIRFGDVRALQESIRLGLVKIPDDLVNLRYGNNALHVAARYGRVEMLKFLVTGLEVEYQETDAAGKQTTKTKRWSLDATTKNDKGHTPKNIAAKYGFFAKKDVIREYMTSFLNAAEVPAGLARDQALSMAAQRSVPKDISPKSIAKYHVPVGNIHVYTGRKDDKGNSLDAAELYTQIRIQYEKNRVELNKKSEKKVGEQNLFLYDVKTGKLTEESLKQYVNKGGRVDCTNGRQEGSLNALHIAIMGGKSDIVQMLVDGVCNDSGQEIARIKLDDRSRNLLKEALQKDPKSTDHQKIAAYFQKLDEPKPVPANPTASSLQNTKTASTTK